MAASRLENFSWNCAKVFGAFFFGGIVLAWAIDLTLISIFVAADQFFYPNRLGALVWKSASESLDVVIVILSFLFGSVLYAMSQFFSAALALLSFVVISRVSFWWILLTTPLIGFAYGQSSFADLYWQTFLGDLIVNARWYHLINGILQVPISIGSWWIARKSIRPGNHLQL